MKEFSMTFLILTTLAFFTGIAPQNAMAQTTWTVDDDGSADFTSIQAAINMANPGDIVLVADGTYSPSSNGEVFPIIMKDGVRLVGAGSDVCVLNAENTGSVIVCNGIGNIITKIEGFTITNGLSIYGGGIHCINSSLDITKNVIHKNKASGGGGIFCSNSSPKIENNIISMNETKIGIFTGSGGGIYLSNYSKATISNCIIFLNAAEDDGGGICHNNHSKSIVINSTIYGNSSGSHGYGGGTCIGDYSESSIVNTILWGNSALGGGPQIIIGYKSKLLIDYSDVDGGLLSIPVNPTGTIFWGSGIIDANPQFVNPAPLNSDLHLSSDSPCIDAGDNNVPGLPAFDLEGNPRFYDGDHDGLAVIDMGAFEYTVLIMATIDIHPDTLNLKSKGKWITAYIELPEGYDVNDINIDTVELKYNNSSVNADWGDVQEYAFMVKFDRDLVKIFLNGVTGNAELKVIGEVAGTTFEGTDTIKVINKGK